MNRTTSWLFSSSWPCERAKRDLLSPGPVSHMLSRLGGFLLVECKQAPSECVHATPHTAQNVYVGWNLLFGGGPALLYVRSKTVCRLCLLSILIPTTESCPEFNTVHSHELGKLVPRVAAFLQAFCSRDH